MNSDHDCYDDACCEEKNHEIRGKTSMNTTEMSSNDKDVLVKCILAHPYDRNVPITTLLYTMLQDTIEIFHDCNDWYVGEVWTEQMVARLSSIHRRVEIMESGEVARARDAELKLKYSDSRIGETLENHKVNYAKALEEIAELKRTNLELMVGSTRIASSARLATIVVAENHAKEIAALKCVERSWLGRLFK